MPSVRAMGNMIGAISTIQPLDTTPGTVSLIAGRLGRFATRLVEAMPSTRTPPPWRPGASPARPSNMIGMRPAITSLIGLGIGVQVAFPPDLQREPSGKTLSFVRWRGEPAAAARSEQR